MPIFDGNVDARGGRLGQEIRNAVRKTVLKEFGARSNFGGRSGGSILATPQTNGNPTNGTDEPTSLGLSRYIQYVDGIAYPHFVGSNVHALVSLINLTSLTVADDPYTMVSSEKAVEVDTSGGDVTVRLYDPTGNHANIVSIKKTDAANSVFVITGGFNIDDLTLPYELTALDETFVVKANDNALGTYWDQCLILGTVTGDQNFIYEEFTSQIRVIVLGIGELSPDNSEVSPAPFTFTELYSADIDPEINSFYNMIRLNGKTVAFYGAGDFAWPGTVVVVERRHNV